MNSGKAIFFSAPSGSGKTTVVKHLLQQKSNLGFSISATTRASRPNEQNGKDYYFLSVAEFEQKIKEDAFVEWEQVYDGLYYGTLKSEVERLWSEGKHVLFDVDVLGGLSLKKYFKEKGLAVFVKVPGIEILEKRLRDRKSESEESIARRLERVKYEMTFEDKFDITLVNDDLEKTLNEAEQLVDKFLNN